MKLFIVYCLLLFSLSGFSNSPLWSAINDPLQIDPVHSRIANIILPENNDTLKIEYQKTGNAKQILILLHGFGSSTITWRNNLDALSQKFTVYAYNHLGAGKSNNPFEKYDRDAFKKQLLHFMDYHKIKKAILVGNSMGGQIALDFAGDYPERVSGFVLIDPSGGSDVSDKFLQSARSIYNFSFKDFTAETVAFVRGILDEIYFNDELVTDELVVSYSSRWESKENREALRHSATDFRLSGVQYYFLVRHSFWLMKHKKKSQFPILIIWGKEDPWLPVEGANKFEEAFPGCEVRLIDNAGHLPHVEAPEIVNNAITEVFTSKKGIVEFEKKKTDWFIRNLSSENNYLNGYSADVLGELKIQKAISQLLNQTGNMDEFVSYHAKKALLAIHEGVLAPAIDELDNENFMIRNGAVEVLGNLKDTSATIPVIKLLNDPEVVVRQSAITALQRIEDPRAAQPLINVLNDEEGEYLSVADYAKSALQSFGEPAVPALIEGLKNNDINIKSRCSDVLGEIGSPAYQPLVEAINSGDDVFRSWVVITLGKIHDSKIPDVLKIYLNDKSPDVRSSAIWGLGEQRNPAVIELLSPALSDSDYYCRRDAIKAFAKIGQPAIPELTKTVRSGENNARLAAGIALGLIKKDAVDSLLVLLDEKDENIKLAASAGLGRSKYVRIVDNLVEAMNTGNMAIRDTIAIALGKFGSSATAKLIPALNHKSASVRMGVIYALGMIRDPKSVSPLVQTMQSNPDSSIRTQALISLRNIKDSAAIEPISQQLRNDKSQTVRINAAYALGLMKDERAIPALYTALNDKIALVRINSAWALGEFGSKCNPEFLEKRMAKESDGKVRAYIIGALGKIQSSSSVPILIDALSDKNKDVRNNAAWALGQIKDERAVPELIRLLQNENDLDVKRSVVFALGEIKHELAIEPLINQLDSTDIDLKEKAFEALKKISGESMENDATAWKNWWSNNH